MRRVDLLVALLVDVGGHRVMFDAGCDPLLLLEHLEKLQIDPKSIEHAVISHQHGDHLLDKGNLVIRTLQAKRQPSDE